MASDVRAPSSLLTETEANILCLYDQLRELQLQLALLKSQQGQDAPGQRPLTRHLQSRAFMLTVLRSQYPSRGARDAE